MTEICIHILSSSELHTYSLNARKILQIQNKICNYCKRYVVP